MPKPLPSAFKEALAEKPVVPVVAPVQQSAKPAKVDPAIKSKFSGVVVTGDKLGAGTDARVEIWLTDVNVSTHYM